MLENELANAHLALATKLSEVYIFRFELADGSLATAKATFVNIWESLGYAAPPAATTFGEALALVVMPEDQERAWRDVEQAIAGNTQAFQSEYRIRHADGSIHWNLARGIVLRDDHGRPTELLGTSVDVTEMKRIQDESRRQQERLELAIVGSKTLIWDVEINREDLGASKIHFTNAGEMLGYGEEFDLPYAEAVKLMHEDDVPVHSESVAALFASNRRDWEGEFRFRHRDGSVMWFLLRGVVTRDAAGVPVRFTGINIDITERKLLAEQLQLAKERLELGLRSSGIGLFDIRLPPEGYRPPRPLDLRGALINVFEPLGYEPNGGDMADQIMFDEDRPAIQAHTQAYLRGEVDRYEIEHRHRARDGSARWKLARGLGIANSEGETTRIVGCIVDLTERKSLEEEVRAAQAAAEAANRAKDEFLAHVSHELRTPLNAILGMTELALDSSGEHQKQLLRTARSAAGNLLDIVNDLLDFSRIEAGKLTLDVADFSLRTMLGDLMRSLAPRAAEKGLALRHAIDDDVPDVLRGDEGRLRQVLVNLLGNAIKFTATGEARLAIRVVERAPDRAVLACAVHDTGIGIARNQQEVIFRAFEQGDASTTRNYGGTGLGLTISAQLAELMGGRIAVDSEVGRGSTFVMTAPFALGTPSAILERRVETAPAQVRPAVAPRVLVAEDNELNVAVVREILNQRGYHADYVADGRDALAHVAVAAYDLLLLDLHMPELDGFAVVRAIRERERETGRHLPIIALTARSAQKDREDALAAGMDAFLAKPVEVNTLWTAIDRVLAAYPPSRPGSLLDRETIARVSGGRPDVLARLIGVFCSTLPVQLARSHAAFDDHDFARLRDAAHRLHGTLAAFSTIAGAAALELEDASTRAETAYCRALLDKLDWMSGELLESIRTLQL